jgi:thiol:disulfide interchange protein
VTCKTNEAVALNTAKTNRLVEQNGVIAMRADKTDNAPDVDQLLIELGNESRSIPYLIIYPADGSEPVKMAGPVSQTRVLRELEKAGPSRPGSG